MYGATEQFNNTILGDTRKFKINITCGENESTSEIKDLIMHSFVADDKKFTIGGALSSYVEISLWDPGFKFEKKEFFAEIGIDTEDGTEWCPLGYFMADKVRKGTDGLLNFQAYDRMYTKLYGAYFSDLEYPTDAKNVLAEIAQKTGVEIDVSNLEDGVLINPKKVISESEVDTAGNKKDKVTYDEPFNGYTYREALGYIAMLYCKYAIVGRDGKVKFIWYTESDYNITDDYYNDDFEAAETAFTVGKITCNTSEEELEIGKGTNNVQLENPIMTAERLSVLYEKIKNLQFIPVSFSFYGDIRIETCDLISITRPDGIYKVPIMEVTQDFDGGLKTSVQSYGGSEQESAEKGPILSRIDRQYTELILVKEIVGKKANFDYVYAMNAEFKILQADSANFKDTTTEKLQAVSADISSLKATSITTDKLSTELAKIGVLTAEEANLKYATIANLNATDAKINSLQSIAITTDNLSAKVAVLGYAKASELEAAVAKITVLESSTLKAADLSAEVAKLGYATVTQLNATDAKITSLSSKAITTDNLSAEVATLGYATVKELDVEKARIDTLEISTLKMKDLSAEVAKLGYATISQLNATNAELATVKANQITTEYLKANYASIDLANVKAGSITTAMIGTGAVGTAQIADSSITDAKIVSLTANKITAGTLDAAQIEVINLNAANITAGVITADRIALKSIDSSKLSDTLNGTITSAKDTANSALSQIEGLEIGGRNLARDTSSEWSTWVTPKANMNNAAMTYCYIKPGDKAVGDTFVVSFDIEVKKFTAGSGGAFNIYVQGAMDGTWGANPFTDYSFAQKALAGDFTEHVSYIVTINNETQANAAVFEFGFRCNYSDGTGMFRIKNFKVERGNKATDWTPAPEDTESSISEAKTLANNAIATASTAQSTADGKNTVFYQTSAPSTTGRKVNDIWFDTDDGNKMYHYTGSAWAATQFGVGAIADGIVTADKIEASVNAKLTSAFDNANTALSNAATAQSTANAAKDEIDGLEIGGRNLVLNSSVLTNTNSGSSQTTALLGTSSADVMNSLGGQTITVSFDYENTLTSGTCSVIIHAYWRHVVNISSTSPSSGHVEKTLTLGTLSAPTESSYIIYSQGTFNGSLILRNVKIERGNKATDWTPAPEDIDSDIASVESIASAAQTTADGKNTVFYQTTSPSTTGRKRNDVWFDTDDGHKMYYFNGTGWAPKQFGTSAIANASITNALIADATIQSAKIANLDAGKITSGYISADRIKAATLTADKLVSKTITAASGVIADAAILTANIADLAVSSGKIANAAIGTAKIADLAVTNAKIANLAITNAKIADATIQSAKIASLDAAKITSGYISADRINAGSITYAKLDSAAVSAINALIEIGGRNLLRNSNFSNGYEYWHSENANVAVIKDDVYGYALSFFTTIAGNASNRIYHSAYSHTVGEKYAVSFYAKADKTTAMISNIAANGESNKEYSLTTEWTKFTHTYVSYYTGSLTFWPKESNVKLYLTHVKLEKGNKATDWTPAPKDVEAEISEQGIGNWCYNNNLSYINGGKIYTGTVTANAIAANAVTAGKIAANAVTAGTIAASAVATDKIAANAITAAKIASRTITADKIVAGAITGNEIAAKTITANNIVANTITAASGIIADAAITNAKIASLDAAKITSGYISADRINAGSITYAKLDSAAVSAINALVEVGGRNLALESETITVFVCGYGNNVTNTSQKSSQTYLVNGRNVVDPYKVSFKTGSTGDLRFYRRGGVGDAVLSTYDLSNKTYTMSTWVMADTDCVLTSYVTRQYNDSDGSSKGHTLTANTWTRIIHSRTFSSRSDLDGIRVRFTCASTVNIVFCLAKVELGNKATDWTPAPEDVEAEISEQGIGNWCYNNNLSYINGGKIYTGTVTADKISVSTLSAITANLGTVNAGIIQSPTYSYSSGVYSTSGMQIGLSGAGYIRAKNFALDSSGNAYIKGSIDATSLLTKTELKVYSTDSSDYESVVKAMSWDANYKTMLFGFTGSTDSFMSVQKSVKSEGGHITIGGANTDVTITDKMSVNSDGVNVFGDIIKNGTSLDQLYADKIHTHTTLDKPNFTNGMTLDGLNIFDKIVSGTDFAHMWRITSGGNFNPYMGKSNTGQNTAGEVNIGNTDTYIKNLYYGGSLSKQSDRRIKNDLGDITEKEAMTLLKYSRPKKFTYKSDKDQVVQYGAYAQDVRDLLKSSGIGHTALLGIDIEGEDGIRTKDLSYPESKVRYSLDYEQYVSPLIVGWQNHDRRLNELESRIAKLTTENAQIRAENAQLLARIEKMEEEVA